MPRHHMQHARNMGPILFAHNENTVHVMSHVTARAVTSCVHHAAHARRQASHPNYTWRARFTYGRAVRTSRTIFIKNNRLTF